MASANKRQKGWSYSTGEWGANLVRAYNRGPKGIFLEFYETSPETGERRRARIALGHSDRELAKAKADEVALAFRRQEPARPPELTLAGLFEMYEREVTREKGETSRLHDARCAEMFTRFLGASRKPKTLSRRDWDSFIAERRRGAIAPAGVKKRRTVGDRIIAYDLKYLLAVLNWAALAGDGHGGVLLERNPLKGLPLPKEQSPRRPLVTAEQYVVLRREAAKMSPRIDLFLVLAHETGHRAASIRKLRWSDVDLERKTVLWRGEHDKIGYQHVTPLTDEAVTVLVRERSRAKAIGDAWIFPSLRKSGQCLSGDAAYHLWKRLAVRAGLPRGERMGWHSLRRKFATEMKETPLKDLCALGGWKEPTTLLTCYIRPDEATQRQALAQRRSLGAAGIS